MKCKYFLISCFICFWVSLGFSQKTYVAQYRIVDSAIQKSLPNLQSVFNNQIDCRTYINQLQQTLKTKGYITNSIDSVLYEAEQSFVELYLGKQYEWAKIDYSRNDTAILYKCGWDEKNYNNKEISFDRLAVLQQKMLNHYQENGYPFAKIDIDSITINDNQIEGKLITDKGYFHKIDSFMVTGNVKISSIFLQKFLGIPNGSMYKKSLLDAIPRKINQLSFVQQQFPYNFRMMASSSVVNLYLQPRKSSIINVLLGVIPQPNPNGVALGQAPSSKLFLSGDANILLNNMLAQGETIGLTYQQLSINSRRLNLGYRHPYLFKSNYGIDAIFELYKRDSSYLNLDAQLGVLYSLGDNKTGKLFIQAQRTNTFPDTTNIRFTKRLPDNLDTKIYNVGFQYDLNSTDYRRNPRKGNEVNVLSSFGTKTIFINSGVSALKDNSFNYTSLYDTVKKKTYQFKIKAYAAHYFKIRRQSVFKAAFNGGLLLSQNYFRNELFQLGGFKLLRGFDEESQFCNQYAVGTAEFRYLIGGDSFFYIFTDGGYTGNNIAKLVKHTLIGTGIGLNFASKAGVFNFSFAVGGRDDIPIGFKQAKLHFGYVNVF
jgi:outer membrane translocation and assembly module TamA